MFAKLVAVILGIGVIGCGLLALRQQRLEAASELARVQVRIRDQDERLWRLRSDIARRTTPEHVREMAAAIGPLRPLVHPLPAHELEMRRAAGDRAGPRVVDAAPLPRVPTGVPSLASPPGAPKLSGKNRASKYAKVETER